MPKKTPLAERIVQKTGTASELGSPLSFEASLGELEKIVTRLESGILPLEEALDEFERGVQLARLGQQRLKQAEQRVQILLHDDADAPLSAFISETK